MPAAVGALVGYAVTFFGTAVGGFIATTALNVGLAVAANQLLKKKGPGMQPRDIVVRSGTQPQMVIYGKAAAAGVLVHMNQRPIAGDDNFELWATVVHAGHLVESMDDFIYEDSLMESGAELNWSGGATFVDSGPWHADDATHEASAIYTRPGSATQTLPSTLTDLASTFTELSASPLTHHGRGLAYSVHRWQIFDESEEVFRGNQPSNIRAIIEGSLVYDPRLDSTQVIDSSTSPVTMGSGAHRTSDSGTWAYSNNPILCAADYMVIHWGFDESRFDWEYIAGQADKCDVLVVVPPSASPQNTQKRFTCNGVISLGEDHDSNVAKILMSCLGARYMSNGKIRLRAGGIETPDFTITEEIILQSPGPGPIIRTALPRKERYNRVTAVYMSAEELYTATEALPKEDAGFVSRDNDEVITEPLELSMVTEEYQSQRIQFLHLQKSDQQVRVTLPLSWAGMRCTAGSYVAVTLDKFNWSSKVFMVERVQISQRGVPVTVTLREDSSTAWADPTVGEYTTRDAAGFIVLPTRVVPAPGSMAATAGTGGNDITWTNPPRESFDYIEVYASATSAWAGASVVGTGITSENFSHRLADATVRYYWVRAFKNGVASDREPNSDTSDRTATVPSVGSGADAFTWSITSSNGVAFVQAPDDGAWNESTTDVTFTCYQAGSAVSTHVIRFTRTGNSISAATQSETGAATTETITNNASSAVTVRITHDSSGISSPGQSVIAIEGGSEGSAGAPGDGSNGADGALPIAAFGGQWGAFGDLLLTPNENTSGANDGEILVENMAGGDYLVFAPDTQDARTNTRFALMTPWEGDVSTTLDPVGEVFYVICGAEATNTRFNSNFQTREFFTATYNASTGVWTAYPDSTAQGITFTPLSTDAIVAVGHKPSSSPAGAGISTLTQLTVNLKLDASTATLFLSSASITSALIQDLAVGTGKIANLAVDTAKIAAAAITTAKITDLNVTTLKIANEAVIVPRGVITTSTQAVTGGGNTGSGEAIGSGVSIDSEQNPVLVTVTFIRRRSGDDANGWFKLERNGSAIAGWEFFRLVDNDDAQVFTVSYYDTSPPSGSNVYRWWVRPGDGTDTWNVDFVTESGIGTKGK